MLKLFPDFPDLYSNLLKKLEELTNIPQPDDNRIEGMILNDLKHNMAMIKPSFTSSKWNMGEFFGLKFHILYRDVITGKI